MDIASSLLPAASASAATCKAASAVRAVLCLGPIEAQAAKTVHAPRTTILTRRPAKLSSAIFPLCDPQAGGVLKQLLLCCPLRWLLLLVENINRRCVQI